MIDRLTNAIKTHSASLDQASGQAKFGIVTSVNSQTATARVTIQPDGVLSGWLPILSQWIGNGWGMVCPLDPGDQVLVVPQEGDVEQGVIVGRAFSVNQTPPQAPSDEFWMVHKSGSYLKLCNDGTIRINGDLHVQGDVYDSHGALSHLRASYNQHTHVTPPNNHTGLPSPQD
jgi:uncharacterized protein involved in type VI secretion and phage assembly